MDEYFREENRSRNDSGNTEGEFTELEEYLSNIKQEKDKRWAYFYTAIIGKYWINLKNIVGKNASLIDNKTIITYSILRHIISQLNNIAYRVLIVEVNYARNEGKLKGSLAEERADYFSNVLLRDKVYLKSIYESYPELIRLLDLRVKYSLDFVDKMISDSNRYLLDIEFNINLGNKLGKIENIIFSEGDTHNKGKCVSRLLFNKGESTIIYKPRNLDIEDSYNHMIDWINKKQIVNNLGPIKTAKIFSQNESGWMEFITYDSCKNEKEVMEFYSKMGLLVCVLYTLSANDLHSENMIAFGNSPVIIDLETIIQPEFKTDIGSLDELISQILGDSIKRVAVLPTYLINKKENKKMDIGGMGNHETQESAFQSNFIANIMEDNVKLMKSYMKVKMDKNNPILNSKVINAADYYDYLKNGFIQAYQWIMKNREEYSSMVIRMFSDIETRVIFRATRIYFNLLDVSYHPDLLTKHIDRQIYMHRLGIGELNHLIVKQELEEMMDGDIPLFTVNSSDLSNQDRLIFSLSAVEKAVEKVRSMNKIDLGRQISIMRGSFQKLMNFETGLSVSDLPYNSEKEDYLKIVEDVIDKIFERSIHFNKDGIDYITWLGNFEDSLGVVDTRDIGDSLYCGKSGIIYLLLCYLQCTNSTRYLQITKALIHNLLMDIGTKKLDMTSLGLYEGLGGCLYILYYSNKVLEDIQCDNEITEILQHYESNIANFENYDVLSGMAGVLGLMTDIYECSSVPVHRELAWKVCNSIINKLKNQKICKDTSGITWGEEGYIGFAHGNAGISAQLGRFYSITGDEDLLDMIQKSLVYENRAYSDTEKNWARTSSCEVYSGGGWCHGAPGILLNRLMLKRYGIDNKLTWEDIQRAIETCKRMYLGKSFSLCHGDCGNLLLLRIAAAEIKDKQLLEFTEDMLNRFLCDFYRKQIADGGQLDIYDNNSLFVGLAGIGYTLLKFKYYDLAPNIFILKENE